MSIFEILVKYQSAFLLGIIVTLKLCAIIWGTGLFVGLVFGTLGSKSRTMNMFVTSTNFFLSSIPVLVLLFWLHYPLQTILDVVIDPFITTSFTLSLINIFGVANLVRNYLLEIPIQYKEVATVCNISSFSIFTKIEFPTMFRLALPSIVILQLNMLHLTLFGSLISVEELFRVSQQINAEIYQPIEVYTTLAIFFLIICLPISALAIFLKSYLFKYQMEAK
jgi:ABC-type amino acid transport system permease subunit